MNTGGSTIRQILLIVILTALNAFFASAEMAIVSLNKNKIRLLSEEGNKKAALLEKLTEEPSKFLATIQVGITLAGFFASASAATGLSGKFAVYLERIGLPYASQIALFIITIILSYFTLVFGELYPKRIALQMAEKIAMFSVRPLIAVSKVTKPFIRLLSSSTNLLVRISGIKTERLDEKVSMEEIRSLIEVGQEHGVINETEKEMIESIFEFDNKVAEEVMTPRTEVFAIDINSHIDEIIDELTKENYSRVPVYEEEIDNIIGILYMKDFLIAASKCDFKNVDIRKILRTPYFVPATKSIDELFKELQRSKNHMAVLINEYGGFEGIVTIEDLIEEVMGKILDEYDEGEPDIVRIDNNTYITDGLITLSDLNDYLHTNFESEHSDTIGGFVIGLIGNIPKDGEETRVEYKDTIFEILEVKEKRIEKIKIILNKSENI
ncbi:MAG: HlyC/CorC family transporter [Clostridiales bacterium]|uniref:hemolysin family protein n=1 Tax=Clostridium sp. N3C TaxID=1776758 RepID=UPI00092E030E|nr:hemolysin family protein [Clostridium sp. N3C]NLZ47458.1 HlyC/CorC family transporter [Clostridiales bacterium]SCN24953.1 Magnesium and cobalt efflux protein CorC [Clostridium sp. N3C]